MNQAVTGQKPNARSTPFIFFLHQLILCIALFGSLLSCKGTAENTASLPEVQAKEQTTFTNPLLPAGADPWVIQKDGMYYYTHTTGNRLVIRTTERMGNLKEATPVTIWTPPSGKAYSLHIWAPELHFLDGKWYMYFAATHPSGEKHSMNENRRMFVLENGSANPQEGQWEFKGKVADETDKWAIDGTILEHEGKRYFIWSGWRGREHQENTGRQQLYIARMANPWTLEGERVMISEPEYAWEKNGLVNEGPVILKNQEGGVFLFYSASGCWTDEYKLGTLVLAEGGNPLNPEDWTKHPEPLFTKKPEHQAFGPGHNSFFKSPDGTEDWILYHANANAGEGCGGKRSPRMQKIGWNEKEFPVLGEPKDLSKLLTVPSAGQEK